MEKIFFINILQNFAIIVYARRIYPVILSMGIEISLYFGTLCITTGVGMIWLLMKQV